LLIDAIFPPPWESAPRPKLRGKIRVFHGDQCQSDYIQGYPRPLYNSNRSNNNRNISLPRPPRGGRLHRVPQPVDWRDVETNQPPRVLNSLR
jgi:hypothetical protein